jgi:cbb3-type cytochrome oxidase subunit 3
LGGGSGEEADAWLSPNFVSRKTIYASTSPLTKLEPQMLTDGNAKYLGAVSYFVFGLILTIPFVWLPEYELLLGGQFWAATLLFLISVGVIAFLYRNHGASDRGALVFFGALLILAAAIMSGSFEAVAKDNDFWRQHFPGRYGDFFILTGIAIAYAKDIVAFGIAAIGANIVAAAILDCTEKAFSDEV